MLNQGSPRRIIDLLTVTEALARWTCSSLQSFSVVSEPDDVIGYATFKEVPSEDDWDYIKSSEGGVDAAHTTDSLLGFVEYRLRIREAPALEKPEEYWVLLQKQPDPWTPPAIDWSEMFQAVEDQRQRMDGECHFRLDFFVAIQQSLLGFLLPVFRHIFAGYNDDTLTVVILYDGIMSSDIETSIEGFRSRILSAGLDINLKFIVEPYVDRNTGADIGDKHQDWGIHTRVFWELNDIPDEDPTKKVDMSDV